MARTGNRHNLEVLYFSLQMVDHHWHDAIVASPVHNWHVGLGHVEGSQPSTYRLFLSEEEVVPVSVEF
jgi:hypothetical protein